MKTNTNAEVAKQTRQMAITAICVHALCADGKTRKVQLRPGHAAKLHNWIRVASGGLVVLYDVPVAIVAAEPKKSWWTKLREWSAAFRRPRLARRPRIVPLPNSQSSI